MILINFLQQKMRSNDRKSQQKFCWIKQKKYKPFWEIEWKIILIADSPTDFGKD